MNKFGLQMNDKFHEPSNCFKYLGVYLNQNLSFQEEVKQTQKYGLWYQKPLLNKRISA